jgi:protein FAM32A
MAPGDYSSVGAGKLKLKGVKDSKVDKKKKKKKSTTAATVGLDDKGEIGDDGDGDEGFRDRSVVLKRLEDEDREIAKESRDGKRDGREKALEEDIEEESAGQIMKTEAEKRYEEQRRKRVSPFCPVLRRAPGVQSIESILNFTIARGTPKTRGRQDTQRASRRAKPVFERPE